MIPFAWFLAPLLKKWQTWVVLTLAALLFYAWSLRRQVKVLTATLAVHPAVVSKVETRVEVQTKIVRVAGPVRVETKTVYVPGTKEIRYVDRVVETAPVTTTTQTEKASDNRIEKTMTPACPTAAALPQRYTGLRIDDKGIRAVRAGVTVWRLDLGASYDWKDRAVGGEAALRF